MDLVTDALKDRYREPQRRYHTLQHVAELLALLDAHRAALADPAAVHLAIWFHDAVYEPMAPRGDNERRSEALFAAEWQDAGGASAAPRLRLVSDMIIATIDHDVSRAHPSDVAYFLDFDMSILGAPDGRYREYAGQVRGEYPDVPDSAYRAGRSAFLRGALEKPVLFYTPTFRALCDAAARGNMRWELDQLRG